MKKILLFLVANAIVICTHAQKPFTVTGHFTGVPSGSRLYFEKLNYNFVKSIDTIITGADGGFIFIDTAKEEGLYRVKYTDALNFLLIIKPETQLIKIETDTNRIKSFDYTIEMSPLTTQIRDFVINANQQYQTVQALYMELQNPMLSDSVRQMKQLQLAINNQQALQFVQGYLDTVTDPVIAAFGALSFVDIKSNIAWATKLEKRLFEKHKENSLVRDFVMQAEQIKKEMQPPVAFPEGTIVPNIILTDTAGKEMNLYDIKGKYVLIDFWASWCSPCRMENPNVVAMFNKFKDKGFTVFSISLDSDKKKWIAAIAKDKLAWPYHVSELKGWQSEICKPWKIHSIPSSYLIDKDHKVIGINLRDVDLQNKLEEIFKGAE